MKFVIPIVSVWDLAKDIAANGHGEESQLLAWLMAEARRGAFPIYDTANGTNEIWVTSLVEVGLVRPFLIQAMGRDPLEVAPMTPVPASVDAPGQGSTAPELQHHPKAPTEWQELARKRAREIIDRQAGKDLFPSLVDVADEIARAFRADGVHGAAGKPLTGAYIKRRALQGTGISSAKGRQLSTSPRRGK